jgi:hypothetical protein
MTRFLHVANGSSTTRTIGAAGIPGVCSIWADPLYEGPVPGGLNDTELLHVRMQYLAGPSYHAWAANGPPSDPVNDLRQWRATIDRHQAYDELILWFEHDLFDQLNLIQLLSWICDHVPRTQPVSLICIGSFPGRLDFKGLGELAPGELASLLETRRPIGEPHYAMARRAWRAFREATPEPLDELRQDDTSVLPFLAPAITRFLQEYPWTTDGLSRTERCLLQLANGDGVELRAAFPQMHEGEQVYYVTDLSLAALAESLSRTSPPLLTVDVSDAPAGRIFRGRVALTDSGRSVLAGQLDKVAMCGIDRWLGGVHLQSGGRLWRWDDVRQRMTSV